MPGKVSAGLLAYRLRQGELEVFLVHPGGPYWKNKDDGAWTIPKGELEPDESPLAAAKREFLEETSVVVTGDFRELVPVRQAGGKLVHAWAIEAEIDPAELVSNTFAMEWPPRSGRMQSFPEIDRGGWFGQETAARKIIPGQQPLLVELAALLGIA